MVEPGMTFSARSQRSLFMRMLEDQEIGEPRTMMVMSHGEAVVEQFPRWIPVAYHGGGRRFYRPVDLNMPLSIPLSVIY